MNIATSTFLAGAFAVGTAMFWGTYGPLLQKGHHLMGSGRLRPFICVGIAYLLVAIVGPIVVMYLTGMEMETSKGKGLSHGWTVNGIIWSTIAGGVGALGAFTLIMAINYGGPRSPIFVMPIVFGCAPIVSTFFSMYINKTLGQISPFFAAGLILVAAGAITILITAPRPAGAAKHKAESTITIDDESPPKAFVEDVLNRTRTIESLLEEGWDATGKGIHTKLEEIEGALPAGLVNDLRFFATIRNKLVHEEKYEFDGDRRTFLAKCDMALDQLKHHAEKQRKQS